jgi:hypothetical protein
MDKIVNRVQSSGLISIDLASFKPTIEVLDIDMVDLLWERTVLKEKEFRTWIKDHDWKKYSGKAVYVHCSENAIIPTWAYMLIGSKLEEVTPDYIIGTRFELEKKLIKDKIFNEDLSGYKDGRIIIKGCSDIPCPEFAMVELVRHIQPVAKSIMYGEPCSTVPVFKRK